MMCTDFQNFAVHAMHVYWQQQQQKKNSKWFIIIFICSKSHYLAFSFNFLASVNLNAICFRHKITMSFFSFVVVLFCYYYYFYDYFNRWFHLKRWEKLCSFPFFFFHIGRLLVSHIFRCLFYLHDTLNKLLHPIFKLWTNSITWEFHFTFFF